MELRPTPVAYVIGFLLTLSISPFAMKRTPTPLHADGLIENKPVLVDKAEVTATKDGRRLSLRRGGRFAPETEIQVWFKDSYRVQRVVYRHMQAPGEQPMSEDWTQTSHSQLKLARAKDGTAFFELDLIHGQDHIHAEGDVAY